MVKTVVALQAYLFTTGHDQVIAGKTMLTA
jgi:hypothetical protein